MNPMFGGRRWVKLWVNEWLDGTTRLEMSDAQRAFWIDLLAMAGRSRFPGHVCAGQVEGKFVGYPVSKFEALMSTPIDVAQTLALFAGAGKLIVRETQNAPIKLLHLELLNWDKYQSEYQRQRPYREAKRKRLHGNSNESYKRSYDTSNNPEGEVEGEVRRKPKIFPAAKHAADTLEFTAFWSAYPKRLDRTDALRAWHKQECEGHLTEILASLQAWKNLEQWKVLRFIPYAATWINRECFKETPRENKLQEGENLYERTKRLEREAGLKSS